MTTTIINEVYEMLKTRKINPRGTFDKGGRFCAEHSGLISVRTPSKAYPYSELVACRTKKYVTAVFNHFGCTTVEELLAKV